MELVDEALQKGEGTGYERVARISFRAIHEGIQVVLSEGDKLFDLSSFRVAVCASAVARLIQK